MTETLAWAVIESYLHTGAPWVLSMGGTRGVRIGYDPHPRRMYVQLPTAPDSSVPPSRLAEMSLEITTGQETMLEVSTASPLFYSEFVRFAGLMTEVFEAGRNSTAAESFLETLARWQEFAASRSVLTADQQLGLMGELVTLEAVIRHVGASAVTSWTGRDVTVPGRHDFRLGDTDLEVKSTRSTRRIHVVHGLEQLAAAPGRPLHILSFRFEAAGHTGGRSLADLVALVRTGISKSAEAIGQFEARLAAANYRDADRELYAAPLRLADAPRIIPVDDECPRVTANGIAGLLHPHVAARVSDVSYRVNLDGLGSAEGEPLFDRVMPRIRFLP